MNKWKFTTMTLVYAALGLSGFIKLSLYSYLEQDSWTKVISGNIAALIIISFLTSQALYFLYKKWIPEEYEKRKDKKGFRIGAPVFLYILSFFLNAGAIFHMDDFFGDKGSLMIHGIVMNKNIQRGAKNHYTYYLSISDTITTKNYYFVVKHAIYDYYKQDDIINKEFRISRLGIMYRKEE